VPVGTAIYDISRHVIGIKSTTVTFSREVSEAAHRMEATAAVALGTACAAILNSCLNALQVERQTGQTRSKKCTNKAANHLRLRTGQIYNTRNSDNGQGLRVCEITSGASTRAWIPSTSWAYLVVNLRSMDSTLHLWTTGLKNICIPLYMNCLSNLGSIGWLCLIDTEVRFQRGRTPLCQQFAWHQQHRARFSHDF